ncbi:hypothetical protein QJQ45_021662, partial [Haematococcus lacustris]
MGDNLLGSHISLISQAQIRYEGCATNWAASSRSTSVETARSLMAELLCCPVPAASSSSLTWKRAASRYRMVGRSWVPVSQLDTEHECHCLRLQCALSALRADGWTGLRCLFKTRSTKPSSLRVVEDIKDLTVLDLHPSQQMPEPAPPPQPVVQAPEPSGWKSQPPAQAPQTYAPLYGELQGSVFRSTGAGNSPWGAPPAPAVSKPPAPSYAEPPKQPAAPPSAPAPAAAPTPAPSQAPKPAAPSVAPVMSVTPAQAAAPPAPPSSWAAAAGTQGAGPAGRPDQASSPVGTDGAAALCTMLLELALEAVCPMLAVAVGQAEAPAPPLPLATPPTPHLECTGLPALQQAQGTRLMLQGRRGRRALDPHAPQPPWSLDPTSHVFRAPTTIAAPTVTVPKEDFDFQAFNAKFKKDEVAKEAEEVVRDGVYKKDDFFDMLSCEALGGGGTDYRGKMMEQKKIDMETFGGLGAVRHHSNSYNSHGRGRGGVSVGPGPAGRGAGAAGPGRGYGYSNDRGPGSTPSNDRPSGYGYGNSNDRSAGNSYSNDRNGGSGYGNDRNGGSGYGHDNRGRGRGDGYRGAAGPRPAGSGSYYSTGPQQGGRRSDRPSSAARPHTPDGLADVVHALPGWGALENGPVRMYSGLLPLTASMSAFYAVVEAEEEEGEGHLPLILFMNGGPGCSSIGGGMFGEIGPLRPSSACTPGSGVSGCLGGTGPVRLLLSEHRWSRFAHLVFADLPVGTGWSVACDDADYDADDEGTADQVLLLLRSLLIRHPWLQGAPLYLAGESYAGHYIPHAALKLQQAAQPQPQLQPQPQALPQLAGLLLINPWTAPEHDEQGVAEYAYHHGLISSAAHQSLLASCSAVGRARDPEAYLAAADRCDAESNHLLNQLDDLDLFNILGGFCYRPPPSIMAHPPGPAPPPAAGQPTQAAASTQAAQATRAAVTVAGQPIQAETRARSDQASRGGAGFPVGSGHQAPRLSPAGGLNR